MYSLDLASMRMWRAVAPLGCSAPWLVLMVCRTDTTCSGGKGEGIVWLPVCAEVGSKL